MSLATKSSPSVARLQKLFWYDPIDGDLIRRIKAGRWGRIPPGIVTGTRRPDGYLLVDVDGKKFLAHRVAFAIAHGQWPEGQIDHIDGDRTNNRLLNLRDVDPVINCQNQRQARSDSSSGILGVRRTGKRWVAGIKVNGMHHNLGVVDTPEEASVAYIEAKRRLHAGNTL